MSKRKERVEMWREEQRKKAIENIGEIKRELEERKQGKKWSLEDDEGRQTHHASIHPSISLTDRSLLFLVQASILANQ